jgi:hypothetical protein
MALPERRMDAHLARSVGYWICDQLAGGGDRRAGEDDVAEVALGERRAEPGPPVRGDEELGLLRGFQLPRLRDALPDVAGQHLVAAEDHVGLSLHCHLLQSRITVIDVSVQQ